MCSIYSSSTDFISLMASSSNSEISELEKLSCKAFQKKHKGNLSSSVFIYCTFLSKHLSLSRYDILIYIERLFKMTGMGVPNHTFSEQSSRFGTIMRIHFDCSALKSFDPYLGGHQLQYSQRSQSLLPGIYNRNVRNDGLY